jgi:hypothetical protein
VPSDRRLGARSGPLREVGLADLDDAWAWAWAWSSDERFFRDLPVDQPADREAERLWLESVMAEAIEMPPGGSTSSVSS